MFQFGVEVESDAAEFGAKLGGHLEELLGGGETEIFGGHPFIEAAELAGQGDDGLLPGAKAFGHGFLQGHDSSSAWFIQSQARHDRISSIARHGGILP